LDSICETWKKFAAGDATAVTTGPLAAELLEHVDECQACHAIAEAQGAERLAELYGALIGLVR